MQDLQSEKAAVQAFGKQFDYDVSYLVGILEASPGAYEAFAGAESMSLYRQELPLQAHFIARVAAMQGEDCGACAQLNLRMAIEAGVERELLGTLLERPDDLPAPLRDVYRHTRDVASRRPVDVDRAERIRAEYGEAAFVELAVVIAGSRIYPAAKRSLLRDEACEILTLDR